MSWSWNFMGHTQALLIKAREDFPTMKCNEPEETIKRKVLEMLEMALPAFPEGSVVNIEASGSQWARDDGTSSNTLRLKLEPVYGFVK